MSQKEKMLEYLINGNRLTPLEALQKFGCLRLGARMWDLRDAGYDIQSRIIKDERTGKHYSEYWLVLPKQFEMIFP